MRERKTSKHLAGLFNGLRPPRRGHKSAVLPEKEYYESLPRKRSSATVLFMRDGKVLVEELTYQKAPGLPGGVVDANESPLDGAVRECREELGLKANVERLLCIDYCHDDGTKGDTVGFVFLGNLDGQVPRPDGDEIVAVKWMTPREAVTALEPRAARRLAAALKGLAEGRTVYCEDGVEPAPLIRKGKPHGPSAGF